METKENIHQGHRQRLLKKLVEAKNLLADHELLECLLFFSIPRQDTNPLAHNLLNVFGGIGGVFSATKEELCVVNGVGEKSAEIIVLAGRIFQRAIEEREKAVVLFNNETLKAEIKIQLGLKETESSVLFLLDKNHKKLAQLVYRNDKDNEVSLDLSEIVRAFSSFRPAFVILAHRHPSFADCYPSVADDNTTAKLYVLGAIHGVKLIDHVIVKGEDGFYSYKDENRLDKIENQANLDKILS